MPPDDLFRPGLLESTLNKHRLDIKYPWACCQWRAFEASTCFLDIQMSEPKWINFVDDDSAPDTLPLPSPVLTLAKSMRWIRPLKLISMSIFCRLPTRLCKWSELCTVRRRDSEHSAKSEASWKLTEVPCHRGASIHSKFTGRILPTSLSPEHGCAMENFACLAFHVSTVHIVWRQNMLDRSRPCSEDHIR